MTVRIDRRGLLAGRRRPASLGALGVRGALAQDARIRLIWWGISEPQRAHREGDRALHRREPRHRRRGRERRLGRLLDRGSRPRPPAATPPTSCRWTTATSSSTRAAACCCRSTRRWRPATLDLSGFSEDAIASGKVDGKTYGVSLGANSSTMIVNTAAFEEAGVALPERGITWDDYAERMAELTEKAGKRGLLRLGRRRRRRADVRAAGCASAARRSTTPRASSASTRTTRPHGSRCGRRCATAAPACRPTSRRSTSSTSRRAWSSLGHAAVSFAHSNQIVGFQAINQAPLVMLPTTRPAAPARKPRPVPQAVDVLQRLRQHRRAGRGGEVRQLLRQRPGGDRGARRRARRAGVGGGARGADRTRSTSSARRRSSSSRASATSPGRCRRRRRPAPARSPSRSSGSTRRSASARSPEAGAETLVSEATAILARG